MSQAPAQCSRFSADPPPDQIERPRLLLVDDVPAMRQFLRMIVNGFADVIIDEASDGLQAVRLLTQNRYSLILLDINLPLIDGMKVLARLRSLDGESRHTPAMILSTVHDKEILRRAQDLGVTHVISKPIEATRLLQSICEVLGTEQASASRDERRRTPRLLIAAKLRLETIESLEGMITRDMSTGGAFIVSERLLPIGTRAVAELSVPHLKEPIVVGCEVVHVRANAVGGLPAGFGVRFLNVTFELARAIVEVFTSPR